MKKKKVFLMIVDAGGGHRGTASSLKAAIEKTNLQWDVRIVNFFEEVMSNPLQNYVKGEDFYNVLLKHNKTKLVGIVQNMAYKLVKLFDPKITKAVREFIIREKPDFVLSIMPNVNEIYARVLEERKIPFGLLVSDFVGLEPCWLLPEEVCKKTKFVAVGCQEALGQYRGKNIIKSGLVIHPKHFDKNIKNMSKEETRKYFKLDPNLFTVMILSGGYGNKITKQFIDRFENSKKKMQIIACCGKNDSLKSELEKNMPKYKNKVVPIGFTTELHLLMKSANLLITKPGPASIMEGIAMHTPLIIYDYNTMPQEAPNVGWVRKNKFGISVKNPSGILSAVEHFVSNPEKLRKIRGTMKKYELEDGSTAVIDAIKKHLK